jgi:hypothetical protein
MTTLWITPSNYPTSTSVSHTTATTDTAVSIASVTPTNDWTLYLKVLTFTGGTNNVNRARINIEDSSDNFMSNIIPGPVRCIVPVNTIPEGRMYSTRWRDFDDFRVGVSGCYARTNLTRITGGTIVYQCWLTY